MIAASIYRTEVKLVEGCLSQRTPLFTMVRRTHKAGKPKLRSWCWYIFFGLVAANV